MIALLPFGGTARVRRAAFLIMALRAATTLGQVSSPITHPLLRLKLVIVVPAEFPMIRTPFIRSPVSMSGASVQSVALDVSPYVSHPGRVIVALIATQRGVRGVTSHARVTVAVISPLSIVTHPLKAHPTGVMLASVILITPLSQLELLAIAIRYV